MARLYDWVKQTVSGTPGTGVITLSTAVATFITMADAGAPDGELVYYTIVDGTNRERGIGTYSTTGPTLTRTLIQAKVESGTHTLNPGTGLSLTSAAEVGCSPVAATHNSRGCLIYTASDTVLTQSADNIVSYTSEAFDTDGFHDTVTNNSRITIPSGKGISKVRLIANCRTVFTAANTAYSFKILKNGGYDYGLPATALLMSAAGNIPLNISTADIIVSDGDYFEAVVFAGTGGTVTLQGSVNSQCWFGLEVIE